MRSYSKYIKRAKELGARGAKAIPAKSIVARYSMDHDPPHVHVFQDGKRILKFNIEDWTVMEGKITLKARKALELLRREGRFNEESAI